MNDIAICIPTFKRPAMLERLIISITNNFVDKSLIKDISIIVLDNDYEKSAERIVQKINDVLREPFKLYYYMYSRRGLSNVRNELIRTALKLNPQYIVFVDDDEYAEPQWLNELVGAIVKTNGDIVRGPVLSICDPAVHENISCWFERKNYPNYSRINSVATGNLIINCETFRSFGVWFDERFNLTGSEDYYFGISMIKKGASVYWASNPIVYENVIPQRSNIRWIMRRKYLGATNFVFVLKLEKRYLNIIKKELISLLYIFLGIAGLSIILFPFKKKYWGLLKLSEGIGGLSGLINIRSNGY